MYPPCFFQKFLCPFLNFIIIWRSRKNWQAFQRNISFLKNLWCFISRNNFTSRYFLASDIFTPVLSNILCSLVCYPAFYFIPFSDVILLVGANPLRQKSIWCKKGTFLLTFMFILLWLISPLEIFFCEIKLSGEFVIMGLLVSTVRGRET